MKCIVGVILIYQVSFLYAQAPKVNNLQKFDQRVIHLGLALGINSAGFALQRKNYNLTTDSLHSLNVVNQNGFNVGIVTDLHLRNNLNLRFIPSLVFAARNLDYNFISSKGVKYTETRQIESTYLDFPLLLKYRSARLNNFAAYFIGGGKYSLDLASNEAVDNADIEESIIKLKRNTYSAEIGIGTDFFLQYAKLSLELKMSYSIQDALIKDNTELSNPIEEIKPKVFFFTISIEG